MTPRLRIRLFAASLSVLAAFLWATYYLFVLAVSPGTRPSAVLLYPFVAGGGAYALWAVVHRQTRGLGRTFLRPAAYLRLALLLGMQVSVLAATFLAGAVDASLLSLLGDVAATPLVVALLIAEQRPELRAPAFVVGLLLSVAGGSLAIAGGHRLSGVHDAGWAVVVTIPLTVAFYFLLSARAQEGVSVPVIVGQSMIAAAVGSLLLAPLLPGGLGAVTSIGREPLLLLLANGVLSFFVAPLCYFRAIERAGVAFPPLLMTGIPVFTLLLSATVLGIVPAPLALVGVPIAVLGGAVALAAGGDAAGGAGPPPAPTASP